MVVAVFHQYFFSWHLAGRGPSVINWVGKLSKLLFIITARIKIQQSDTNSLLTLKSTVKMENMHLF